VFAIGLERMATRWLTLAQLHDAVRPAAGAGFRRLDHDPLARQMLRERLADGLAALECGHRRLFGPDPVLGGGGYQLLELQLQLVDETSGPFRAVPVLFTPQQGDLELEACDHRLGRGHDRAGLRQFGLRRSQFSAEFLEF
jgi:hypothetical protein